MEVSAVFYLIDFQQQTSYSMYNLMKNFKNEQCSSLRNGNESPIPIPKLGAREGVPFLLCRSAKFFRSFSLDHSRATLQASYHRTLRVRVGDPNAPYPHLRGRAGRGRLPPSQTPPPRPDDRGDHPVRGAQQGAYGQSTSLAVPLIPRIWPRGDMWTAPLQVAQFLAGLPQFSDLPPTTHRFRFLSFRTFIPAVDSLLPGPQRDHIIHISSFTPLHLTRGPGVTSPSANQQ